ncbi:MAG: hypothetical protein ACO4AC_05260 [Pseudohongiellaceae bacterium]
MTANAPCDITIGPDILSRTDRVLGLYCQSFRFIFARGILIGKGRIVRLSLLNDYELTLDFVMKQ